MRKTRLVTAVLFAALFCLAACGKTEQKTDTLSVVTSFGTEDGNRSVYESLMKEYEDSYQISISDDSKKSDNVWKNEILERFNENREPDVLFFFSGKVAEPIVTSRQVVSIETIRSEYPDYASNINVSVLKSMKSADGNMYAIPVTGYWEGMFVNKDVFEANQVEIPKDWNQFLDAVQKLKKNGIIPISVSLSDIPHYLFEFFIYNYTGPARHLASVPTNPEQLPQSWIKGLNWFREFYKMGAFPQNVNHMTDDAALKLFQDKKAAMYLSGSWSVGNIQDTENVAVVDFPAIQGEARKGTDMIAGFSMGFYITRKAWEDETKRKAAVDLVSMMTSDVAIAKFNAGVAAPSISSKASTKAENPLLKSILEMNQHSSAYIGAVQDVFNEKAQRELFKEIPGIAEGKVTPQEALKKFIKNNE